MHGAFFGQVMKQPTADFGGGLDSFDGPAVPFIPFIAVFLTAGDVFGREGFWTAAPPPLDAPAPMVTLYPSRHKFYHI